MGGGMGLNGIDLIIPVYLLAPGYGPPPTAGYGPPPPGFGAPQPGYGPPQAQWMPQAQPIPNCPPGKCSVLCCR